MSVVEPSEIEAVGRAMREALHAVLQSLDEKQRTGEGLSKRYAIDGAGARRVIRALGTGDDAELLTRVPGLKTLHKLAQSAGCEQLTEATNAFNALIKRAGSSKADLTRLIRDRRDAANDADTQEAPA